MSDRATPDGATTFARELVERRLRCPFSSSTARSVRNKRNHRGHFNEGLCAAVTVQLQDFPSSEQDIVPDAYRKSMKKKILNAFGDSTVEKRPLLFRPPGSPPFNVHQRIRSNGDGIRVCAVSSWTIRRPSVCATTRSFQIAAASRWVRTRRWTTVHSIPHDRWPAVPGQNSSGAVQTEISLGCVCQG